MPIVSTFALSVSSDPRLDELKTASVNARNGLQILEQEYTRLRVICPLAIRASCPAGTIGKIAGINKQINEAREKLDALNKQISDYPAKLQAEQAEAEQKAQSDLESLKRRVKYLDLKDQYSELKHGSIEMNRKLDEIENYYDKTLMGAYFQDKIGQLLNSDVMCSAVKRCRPGGKMEIPAVQIKNELFPKSEATRSEYYDKVKKRRDDSAP